MDNISKITVNGTAYQVKDSDARRLIEELNANKIDNASVANNELSFYANGMKKCSVNLPLSTSNGLTVQQKEQIETSYLHSQSQHAPANAEPNVQADWGVSDANSDAFIKNKPAIPTKAKQITVEDLGNKFNATNVEGVLEELLQRIKDLEERIGGSTEPITYTITNTLTQCLTNNNNATVTKDSRYTATLTANSGYRIKTITVTMGGTDITSSAVSNDTVTIAKVTGNVVITVVAEIISYPITNTLTKCSTNNNAVKANHNSVYEAIITADDEYKMDSLTITMGGTNITSSVVTPIVETVPTYSVTNTLTHCTTNNTAATVEKDSVYEATITADAEYKMDSIAVTMGGTNINSSYITPIIEDVPDSPRI